MSIERLSNLIKVVDNWSEVGSTGNYYIKDKDVFYQSNGQKSITEKVYYYENQGSIKLKDGLNIIKDNENYTLKYVKNDIGIILAEYSLAEGGYIKTINNKSADPSGNIMLYGTDIFLNEVSDTLVSTVINNHSNSIDNINNEIQDISLNIIEIRENIEDNSIKINNISNQVSTNTEDIVILKENINTLNENVEDIGNKVSANTEDITDINTFLEPENWTKQEPDGSIMSISNYLNGIDGKIGKTNNPLTFVIKDGATEFFDGSNPLTINLPDEGLSLFLEPTQIQENTVITTSYGEWLDSEGGTPTEADYDIFNLADSGLIVISEDPYKSYSIDYLNGVNSIVYYSYNGSYLSNYTERMAEWILTCTELVPDKNGILPPLPDKPVCDFNELIQFKTLFTKNNTNLLDLKIKYVGFPSLDFVPNQDGTKYEEVWSKERVSLVIETGENYKGIAYLSILSARGKRISRKTIGDKVYNKENLNWIPYTEAGDWLNQNNILAEVDFKREYFANINEVLEIKNDLEQKISEIEYSGPSTFSGLRFVEQSNIASFLENFNFDFSKQKINTCEILLNSENLNFIKYIFSISGEQDGVNYVRKKTIYSYDDVGEFKNYSSSVEQFTYNSTAKLILTPNFSNNILYVMSDGSIYEESGYTELSKIKEPESEIYFNGIQLDNENLILFKQGAIDTITYNGTNWAISNSINTINDSGQQIILKDMNSPLLKNNEYIYWNSADSGGYFSQFLNWKTGQIKSYSNQNESNIIYFNNKYWKISTNSSSFGFTLKSSINLEDWEDVKSFSGLDFFLNYETNLNIQNISDIKISYNNNKILTQFQIKSYDAVYEQYYIFGIDLNLLEDNKILGTILNTNNNTPILYSSTTNISGISYLTTNGLEISFILDSYITNNQVLYEIESNKNSIYYLKEFLNFIVYYLPYIEVTPNPYIETGQETIELKALKIQDQIYEIKGGEATNITINPSEEPTEDFNSIKVNEIIYGIPNAELIVSDAVVEDAIEIRSLIINKKPFKFPTSLELGSGENQAAPGNHSHDALYAKIEHTHDYSTINNRLELGNTSTTAAYGNHNHDDIYEPIISVKGTAFNKNFGTTADTVAEGNHTHDEIIANINAGEVKSLIQAQIAENDYFRILVGGSTNNGYAEISTANDGTEPIYIRQYSGNFETLTRTATLLDASGNTIFPGKVNADNVEANYFKGNIYIPDTRGTNLLPWDYNYKKITYEFKEGTTIGLDGYWYVIQTIRGWDGDYLAVQIATLADNTDINSSNALVFYRYGKNNSWGNWKTFSTANFVLNGTTLNITD